MRDSRTRELIAAAISIVFAVLPGPRAAAQEFMLTDEDEWLETRAIDPASPEGRLALARRALAAGDADRAEFLATQWIERFPDNPLLAEAYIVRGDALMAREDYYEALYDYELVARRYAGSSAFVRALQREFEIAKMFARGLKRKAFGIRWADASGEAEELLIRIQERLPGSRLAEAAALELGDFYFRERKMDLATEMYAIFIENFPRSEQVSLARRRLVYAHLASFKGPEFDGSGLQEALTRLQEIKALNPAEAQKMGADALVIGIDDSLAWKRLATAQWYQRSGDPIAAELTIRRMLEDHPRSQAAPDAVRLGVRLLPDLPPAIIAQAPDYTALLMLFDESGADE